MEGIVVIIIVGWLLIKIIDHWASKCPHGIPYGNYNPPKCNKCAELKEKQRHEEEERKGLKEEAIRLAEEKRQEEIRRLNEEIERRKKELLEATRKLEFLYNMSPRQFEELTWILFRKLGWKVEETPYVQDGGSDGRLIKDDKEMILQCKRYRNDIGEPIVRDLYGTYMHMKANGGILVTTGEISQAAHDFAKGKNIELIDGKSLLLLIEKANLTTQIIPDDWVYKDGKLLPIFEKELEPLKRQVNEIKEEGKKENCPSCGVGKLVVRSSYRGLFMGCSRYPACTYTRQYPKRMTADDALRKMGL